MLEKPCHTCQLPKPITDFHRDAKQKDGISFYCKVCTKLKNERTKLPIQPRKCCLPRCNIVFTPKRDKRKACSHNHYTEWKREFDLNGEELVASVDRRKEHVGYEFGDMESVFI